MPQCFLISGAGKVAAPEMTQDYIASAGLPAPLLAYLIAVLVEVGGGILLVLGLRNFCLALPESGQCSIERSLTEELR